uniref:Large ribosomal subunit protein bL32m n=1 Tax=Ixodes scapularis TaxID=6945 RepID=A0A4D5RNB5_IXOSC
MVLPLLLTKLMKLSDAVSGAILRIGELARPPLPSLCAMPESGAVPDREDGVLWAVQTKRRSLERRQWRRIGHPFFNVERKNNIRTCEVCGHFHLRHTICGHCYEKVKLETQQLQEAVQQKLGLQPVEREVALVYQGEPMPPKLDAVAVEVPRPRPAWFSKNLLSRGRTAQPLHGSDTPRDDNPDRSRP